MALAESGGGGVVWFFACGRPRGRVVKALLVHAGCVMGMFWVGGRLISVLICTVFDVIMVIKTNAWVSARRGTVCEFLMFWEC
jgi:hypothetical protein